MTRAKSFLAISLWAYLHIIFQTSRVVSSSSTGGFSLKLIPRDHPTSPICPGNLTKTDRIQRFNKFSQIRISYLLSIITRNAMVDHKEMGFTLQHSSSFYTVEVEIGDPPTTLYLIIDNGSDLTWTQCQPCTKCYQQSIPIYNSKDSSSLREVSYDHSICSTPHSFFMNASNRCFYDLKYADDSWTRGYLFSEFFRVSSDVVLENLIFGCSRGSKLGTLNEDTKISGIMGLANSPVSILSQFSEVFQGMYAYCLRPYDDYSLDPFYLRFGDNIPVIPEVFRRTTNLITVPSNPHIMYLNLLDISVANVRLQLSEDVFNLRDDDTGGLIIDSGCTISRLDDTPGWDPYGTVMASFQQHYDSVGLTRYTGHVERDYTLCYKYDKDFDDYASMTYHLDGGNDYEVKGEFTSNFFLENDHFCVAIMAATGISALGAWHQQNMQLIFDLNHNQLHFASKACMN